MVNSTETSLNPCSMSTKYFQTISKIPNEENWIPHKLSQKNKDDIVAICTNLLNKQNRKSFLEKKDTGDEK